MDIFDIIGWSGSLTYIVSYFLLSYKVIDNGKVYYLLNKIGALLIIIVSISKSTIQPMVTNSIWLYISYMAYHEKEVKVLSLNKYFLHGGTFLFFLFIEIYFFIDINISFEIMAWFSVFAFSLSYFLYTMEDIKAKVFHFYNFLAAFSLVPKMILFENYPVVLLEVLWAFFALLGYIKNTKNKEYLTLCS